MSAPGIASAATTLLSEHRLRMALRAGARGFTQVEPLPRRASQAHRLLIGRTAQQAMALLPTLFPIGAMAHRAAAAAALASLRGDQAGAEPDPRSVLLERMREHLLPVHRDWPLNMGMAPSNSTLQGVERLLRAVDSPRSQAEEAVRELVEVRTLGMPAREFLSIDNAGDLLRWARSHEHLMPARFLAWLSWQPLALGPAELPPPLQPPPARALARYLLGPASDEFEAYPQWQGVCRESSPWARRHAHPLLRDLARGDAEPSAALQARFAARLLDLAETLLAWRDAGQQPEALRAGDGIGMMHTARGLLAYGMALDHGERIARCVILTPAQWNFHPQGTAPEMLRAIAWTTPRQVAHTASLVACAVDPFVRCDFALPQADAQ